MSSTFYDIATFQMIKYEIELSLGGIPCQKKQKKLKFDGRAKLGDIAKFENSKHSIKLTMNKIEFKISRESSK